MKTFYCITLFLFKIFAVELLQNIGNQVIGKGLFFSMRIDDKFDEIILNATVKRPQFLYIGEQGVEFKKILQVDLFKSSDFKGLARLCGKVFVFDGCEIDIYDFSHSFEAVLEQRYFDGDLEAFSKIEAGGDLLIVFQEFEVLVFIFREEKFFEKAGKIRVEEPIFFGKVVEGRVFLVFFSGIQVYKLIDNEIGYFELEDSMNFTQRLKKKLYINDFYTNQEKFYILENQLGILEFELFPLKYTKNLRFFGSRLTGHSQDLCIDGRIVINTNTSALKFYPVGLNCFFLRMDSEFIYCGNSNRIFIVSRQVSVQQNKVMDFLYGIEIFENILFLIYHNKILLIKPKLGPLNIEGKTPDSVGEHRVVFEIESISGNLTETFLLTVQYNLSDVIIFILVSFISIFFFVFICSCVLKFINKTPQEPIEIGRISTDPQPSSERNILSDRNLIRK